MSDPVDQRKKRSHNMNEDGIPMSMYQKNVRHHIPVQEPEDEFLSSEEELEEDVYDPEGQEMGGDEESGEEYDEEYMDPEYDEISSEAIQPRAEVEQPRAQAEQPSPPRAQAQAPAEPVMRSQAEQVPQRSQAELNPPQRAQAEQLPPRAQAEYQQPPRVQAQAEYQQPPRAQAEYQQPPRTVRNPPYAKSNGNRRRVVLGFGSDGPLPAVRGPLYGSSKQPSPQRVSSKGRNTAVVVNGRAPLKSNGNPPAVASAQAPSVSVPPAIAASGHGFVTDRVEEFDYGVTPNEDIIFSGSFELRFGATGQQFKDEPALTKFVVTENDLKNIFRVSVKNPDKKLTDPGAYDEQRMDMSQVLIKKWWIKGFSQNTSSVLDVMADPERLKFLNVHYKTGMNRHCMIALGPKAKQTSLGEKSEIILDNNHLINSKAFKTFGHTSISKFAQDIDYPHGETRLKLKQGSQLSKLIIDNEAKLKEHFIKINPIIESCPGGHLVDQDVVFEALLRYHVNVGPLMRGIVDAKRSFVFELMPGQESTWQDALAGSLQNYASTRINVHVLVGVEYCFPESFYKRYNPAIASAPMVDVRAQFQQRLKDNFLL